MSPRKASCGGVTMRLLAELRFSQAMAVSQHAVISWGDAISAIPGARVAKRRWDIHSEWSGARQTRLMLAFVLVWRTNSCLLCLFVDALCCHDVYLLCLSTRL